MRILHLIYLIHVLLIFLSCTADKKDKLLLEQKIKQIEAFDDYGFFVTYFPDSIQRSFWNKAKLKYHPYRYLRDTASTHDLLKLIQSDNPFVKLYSFSALEKRGYKDLYSIVWRNLSDTTSLYVQSDDHGWYSTTADMMIDYAFDKFSKEEKDSLKHKILLDCINLHATDGILMFHKPNVEYYDNIKRRAKERGDVFSLIGLAAYQKTEDFEMIRAGFNKIEYHGGTYVFFKAIENFNDDRFVSDIQSFITKQRAEGKKITGDDYQYLYYALAKYKQRKSLEIIKLLSHKERSADNYWHENLGYIYLALNKYKCDLYIPLIEQIETNFKKIPKDERLEIEDIESMTYLKGNDPWNY